MAMTCTRPFDVQEFRRGMRLLGWSTADVQLMSHDGSTWFVAEAERGGQLIRGEGPTEAAAWADVGWQVVGDS